MNIEFESGANFITAKDNDGSVIIRCGFFQTDCGESESLDSFVKRHGGVAATVQYLKESYRNCVDRRIDLGPISYRGRA